MFGGGGAGVWGWWTGKGVRAPGLSFSKCLPSCTLVCSMLTVAIAVGGERDTQSVRQLRYASIVWSGNPPFLMLALHAAKTLANTALLII